VTNTAYPLAFDCEYRFRIDGSVRCGRGVTSAIGSREVRLSHDPQFPEEGSSISISIRWPVTARRAPLRLSISGTVIERTSVSSLVSIERHWLGPATDAVVASRLYPSPRCAPEAQVECGARC